MITYLTHARKQKQMGRPRAVVKELAVNFVAENPDATRAEIAAFLERKSSPHLWDMLTELVTEGRLEQWRDESYYPALWRYRVKSVKSR